jgi:RNA polymerase sigma-70 factor (ECF subfamily)
LNNEWDRRHAKRRGGGAHSVSLDCDNAETRYRLEPVDALTPELLFERRWAAALIGAVLAQLQTELASTGKHQHFVSLKGFLTADDPRSYAQVAEALGMTEAAVKVAVHRLRRRFRALLRAEVARTVTDEHEIDDEIRYLMARIGAV